jgi:tetratricopeptide (TPR) repeat protein
MFEQCKFLMVVVAVGVLAACATSPTPDPAQPGDDGDQAGVRANEALDDVGGADDIDADLLFHVIAAERLGAVGDYHEALDHYLQAARLGDDPDLARQVVSMAMRLRDWATMVDGARRWQELVPDEQAPDQFLVLGWMNLGEVDKAARSLAENISAAEDQRGAWHDAVVLMAAAEEDDVILATMDELVEHLGDRTDRLEVLQARSHLHWQLDQPDQALALALETAELSGERDQLVWAAQLAAADKQLELAHELYRRARQIAPDERDLGLAEAEVLRQMDQPDRAIDVLNAMPADSEVLYTLGSYLYQAERMEEAGDVWHRLASVEDPDDPVHHAYLVGFLAELLEFNEKALQWYERVEQGPNANRAMLRRAIIEGDRGSLLAARNLLRSVRLGSDHGLREQSWLIEADLLRQAGQAGEAVQLLTNALREQPGSVSLLYTRAICAVAMDDLQLAEQDFRRILQIEDDNAMALNALGYTLTDRTDRYQEAYRLIRRALELEPDSPAIQDSLGWVYFRMGQPEKALPYLEQALEGEDNPEIAAHLGEVLIHVGREEEGLAVLEGALERFPDDQYLIETLQRLGLD